MPKSRPLFDAQDQAVQYRQIFYAVRTRFPELSPEQWKFLTDSVINSPELVDLEALAKGK